MKYLYRDLNKGRFFNHFVRASELTDTIFRQWCIIFGAENLDLKMCLFAIGHGVHYIYQNCNLFD